MTARAGSVHGDHVISVHWVQVRACDQRSANVSVDHLTLAVDLGLSSNLWLSIFAKILTTF